jgi:hypothetical protein
MISTNLTRLLKVAQGLDDLRNQVIFVGGSVAELYADDAAATEIRPTMDVDCVVELATYGDLYSFEELLRSRHFKNDIESGVICRWTYDDETVDIMPDDEHIMGFSNRWYKRSFPNRTLKILDDENKTPIYILPPLYYLATKIEAIRDRGGDDLRLSHDLEDLIYVLNNHSNILDAFDSETNTELTEFLSLWAKEMLQRRNHREEIACMLPYGDDSRLEYILEILTHFSERKKSC